ncbi:MAG: 8-amino-7-oxononanoate synthase [Planctomycetota bacterium]|nr:MAG: 8-amino-7-oxononanoate synthase [Planctomycetota bacterium]
MRSGPGRRIGVAGGRPPRDLPRVCVPCGVWNRWGIDRHRAGSRHFGAAGQSDFAMAADPPDAAQGIVNRLTCRCHLPPASPSIVQASWRTFFEQTLADLEQRNLRRFRGGLPASGNATGRRDRTDHFAAPVPPSSSTAPSFLDFGSNDYLGLRDHPEVVRAVRQAAAAGSGASPVLRGYTDVQRGLETELAQWSGQDSGLVFSSGYSGNLGVLSCLVGSEDLILSDRLNHASLIDGCRLSRATIGVFPHREAGYVDTYLRNNRHRFRRVIVLTESVFSMDGDAAPLSDLLEITAHRDAALVVDEAHAVGVYGHRGAGLLEELGGQSAVLLKLGTLSKALGAAGGYAVGESPAIEYLVNRCRSYVFSTAPSPAVLAAARTSLRLLQHMHAQRQALRARSIALRERLRAIGAQVPSGDAPIVPVILGGEDRVLAIARQLLHQGIYVPAIRPPTVPVGACRLRISLSTRHTAEDLDRLLAALRPALDSIH